MDSIASAVGAAALFGGIVSVVVVNLIETERLHKSHTRYDDTVVHN